MSEETVSLEGAIGRILYRMEEVDPGSDEYDVLTKELERLLKLKNDSDKNEYGYAIEELKAKTEEKIKNKQIDFDRETRDLEHGIKRSEIEAEVKSSRLNLIGEIVKVGGSLAVSMLSIVATIGLTRESHEFTENGCIPDRNTCPNPLSLLRHK